VLDVDVTVAFIELPEAYDVGGEPGDEIHPRDGSVLAVLPLQDHRPGALDWHRGAVAEPHDPADLGVDLLEGRAAPRHVVCGAAVQVPHRVVAVVIPVVKLGEDLGFYDFKRQMVGSGGRCGGVIGRCGGGGGRCGGGGRSAAAGWWI
jgi:uncharacterized membrane protein YgcG